MLTHLPSEFRGDFFSFCISKDFRHSGSGCKLVVLHCKIFALVAKLVKSTPQKSSFLNSNGIFLKYGSPKTGIFTLLLWHTYQEDRYLVNSYYFKWEDPVKDVQDLFNRVESHCFRKIPLYWELYGAMPSQNSCITSKRISAAWKPEIKLIYWLIPTTASQVSSLRIIIFSSSWLISLKLKLVLWHPRIIFQLSLQRII